jgi:phosphoglycolate phosphatase-like HAD superfamily hydrolase
VERRTSLIHSLAGHRPAPALASRPTFNVHVHAFVHRLVLFDIDGTLLWSDGAGRRAMERALTHVFGATGDAGYRYDGKTDRQIVRELMRGAGHGDAHIDDRMAPLVERYLAGLREELDEGARAVRVLPGVPELLDALEERADVVLGLLTGNIEPGAAVKLGAAGIDMRRFRVNAFGSDHEHRPALPAVAQLRARELLGVDVPGARVVIVGDTPADIACGRELGAARSPSPPAATRRRAVGARPGGRLPDLADTDAVLAAIVAD